MIRALSEELERFQFAMEVVSNLALISTTSSALKLPSALSSEIKVERSSASAVQ